MKNEKPIDLKGKAKRMARLNNRQVKWQRKRVAKGKCMICGKARRKMTRSSRCEKCLAKVRDYMRKRRDSKLEKEAGRPSRVEELARTALEA